MSIELILSVVVPAMGVELMINIISVIIMWHNSGVVSGVVLVLEHVVEAHWVHVCWQIISIIVMVASLNKFEALFIIFLLIKLIPL